MDMRTYWKHNVAEDMQVVEYTAEQKAMFPNCHCLLHLLETSSVTQICVFRRVTLSWSVAYFPAGRQSRLWFEGSFGIKSARRRDIQIKNIIYYSLSDLLDFILEHKVGHSMSGKIINVGVKQTKRKIYPEGTQVLK